MLREVSREVDYVVESVALLRHMGEGAEYRVLREDLNKEYENALREGLRKLELLERIEQAAGRVFAGDMEQLQYYFPDCDDAAMGCVGNLLLLWEDNVPQNCGFRDVASYGKYLRELSEQEYCERFGACLQGYTELVVKDTAEIAKMHDPYAVISYLMKMEIKDEEKWKIQKVFFDRAEHTEKVLGFLEKAETLLRGFQTELDEMAEAFYQYWTKQLEGREMASYIMERTNIKVKGSPLGFRVRISIIRTNIIALRNEMGDDENTHKEPDCYRIGVLFGEDFPLSASPKRQREGIESYVMQTLKLLADKSKFQILSYIHDKTAYGSELAKHLNLTTATVSHHMNALLLAGLVEVKRMDNRVYYTTNKEAVREALDYCREILT